jgi:hypothetical protein
MLHGIDLKPIHNVKEAPDAPITNHCMAGTDFHHLL